MKTGLNFIKKLIVAALALHIVSICTVAFVIVFQRPLSRLYITHHLFVLPSISSIATIAVIFILHCTCTLGIWKALGNLLQLKTVSILSFIFVLLLNPLLIRIESFIYARNLHMTEPHTLQAHIILRQLTFNVLAIRSLALSILLIAAAMAFYHCILAKNEDCWEHS